MSVVLLTLRLSLTLVFAVAAVAKLADRPGTLATLRQLGVPRRLVRPLGVGLPLAELAVACLLVPGGTTRGGAVAAAGLLAAFTAAVGSALARGERPDCACFGRITAAPVGAPTLARNVVLAAAASTVAFAGPGAPVTTALLDPVWTALTVLATGVAVLVSVVWQLFRQNGRLVERLRHVEQALGERERTGLAVGTPAPAVETSDGPLAELLGAGQPVALVFSQAGCAACEELTPRLSRLQRESALRVASVHDNPAAVREYGVEIVPSAVLVDAQGRVASDLARGALAVERLLRAAVPAFRATGT